jgi:VanZ family protein
MNSLLPGSSSWVNWKTTSIYYKIPRHPVTMKKVLPFLPATLYYGLIFFLSSRSHTLDVPVPNFDKLAHGAAFSLLGFLLALGFFKSLHASLKMKILCAWLLGAGLGILDEIHQIFVPGRASDPLDATADAIGVGLGILLYWLVVRKKISPGSR